MTVPVLQAFSQTYPEIKLTILSRAFFKPFFEDIPNLNFLDADVYGKHKGIGLLKLAKEAKELGVTLSQLKDVIIYNNGKVDWGNVKSFLSEIRGHLMAQIDDLKRKIDNLDKCYDQINP